ncbi:uncharacterized protein LOC141703003 isoform X2 [Apium graveolens]|uniref:uncharacterized protein LOC141703003 isoform X2 n=1 Tax=Apium graveolens TaxID=4045 RepID=UPI003D7A3F46
MEEEAETILQTGGDQVIHNPSASLERTQSIVIGPGNDEAIGHEKAEGSTAKEVTEEDQVVLDLSKSFEMTETVAIGLVDDHIVEQEKFEGSTAQITVSNDVKDNGRPSVPVDHQDLKWNIITPARVVSGPYHIDDLKCMSGRELAEILQSRFMTPLIKKTQRFLPQTLLKILLSVVHVWYICSK